MFNTSAPGNHLRTFLATITAVAGLVAGAPLGAAEVVARVRNAQGGPVADAVVVALPASAAPRDKPAAAPTPEEVDQIDHEFVPRVKPVLVGSAVRFPNKDNVRHHVYSFSPAKRFELPLYAGTPAVPVVFDKPGVVVLGCNIHDWMIGYIYVSDSPYFGTTGPDGTARLANLPPGSYSVRVWHPQLEGGEDATRRQAELGGTRAIELSWDIRLGPDMRARRAPAAGAHKRY